MNANLNSLDEVSRIMHTCLSIMNADKPSKTTQDKAEKLLIKILDELNAD